MQVIVVVQWFMLLRLWWYLQFWVDSCESYSFRGVSWVFSNLFGTTGKSNWTVQSFDTPLSKAFTTSMNWNNVHTESPQTAHTHTQYTNTNSTHTICMFIWRIETVWVWFSFLLQQGINHFCIIFPIYCWSLANEGHLVLFQYQWIIDKLISNVKYGFVCHLHD